MSVGLLDARIVEQVTYTVEPRGFWVIPPVGNMGRINSEPYQAQRRVLL